MRKLRVLDLFSGIGGFSLGLEATGGFETVAFCEMDEYADVVLEKHWPDVVCYEDVTMITKERLEEDEIGQIDVICGGFPCQDISLAGKGAGLEGERSGLWFEYARIIGEVGPSYVIIENVAALLGRGLSVVLQNLSEIGYDAEWHCIPASYVGAPHRRDRIWIVAHTVSTRTGVESQSFNLQGRLSAEDGPTALRQRDWSAVSGGIDATGKNVADAQGQRLFGEWYAEQGASNKLTRCNERVRKEWLPEPNVGRVANGVPRRVDRLKCLGNAVVPQVVTQIGYAILEAHHADRK